VTLSEGDTPTPEFTPLATGTYTFEVTVSDGTGSDTDTATITVEEAPEPSASVTFDAETVTNRTETVTVDSANYTLADGSAGNYLVVAYVVTADGSISSPVGYSRTISNGVEEITVDLNASGAQGDDLDVLTENTTLRAMLHATAPSSAYGSPLMINGSRVTEDASITVEEPPLSDGVPGIPGSDPPIDPLPGPGWEDVNGDGRANFQDVIDLLLALESIQDASLTDAERDALDFDASGSVDFLDVIELVFRV
jgi:PKD repeat protein